MLEQVVVEMVALLESMQHLTLVVAVAEVKTLLVETVDQV